MMYVGNGDLQYFLMLLINFVFTAVAGNACY